ncbi:branched-chain amino acid aminotransferase/4-amino-4-deoxychorismate lyase [Rhizobium leguminosarum bv. trifolii WSM597]|uniref:Probable branched-chain-amino-acid aminotransferase n=2 Tax=Rhizobium leguminosarum TaxID=384 RepID=I9X0D0_RHILT|nr:aminotransferase class IV family protein [Rhizobium leguminosarum]EJB02201.1 branched-chain amino acid aminotransferase/4-amino-4-deoxychorismate lyase [Rhizobium leguminosarum bv. trifolii WSM597]EJB05564.1 branched-chain amino acid aminotransferase/4-amino-4-deoxychorismate lyase [Rhizobium leguminosarum bv. trifolii WSM597]MBB6222091.1 4-amino-4-deoxychorismate lyase [Rhizobium leguminosarum]
MIDFSLIETLRWQPGDGFIRLRLHLARLSRSARRLGFPQPIDAVARLDAAVEDAAGPLRLRMTFDAQGRTEVTSAAFVPLAPDTTWTIRIAETRLDSTDRLLRHKTTRRAVYESARAEYTPAEADDLILLNERGEICEGTITSVFLDDGNGMLRTPPISCGLLAGVLRTELICARKARVGRLTLADLDAGALYVGNSLRGLIRANLIRN